MRPRPAAVENELAARQPATWWVAAQPQASLMLRLTTLIVLSLVVALSRMASSGAAVAAKQRVSGAAVGARAAEYARRLLGIRYAYGGTNPRTGFDCSGFVRFVWSHFGVHLAHSSYAQYEIGRRVGRSRLRPGDLVFFDHLGHVGIYIGHNRFVHAPHTGTVVKIDSLGGPYGRVYEGARRVR
jgi:cell wall-associated NlpC family hydrolase